MWRREQAKQRRAGDLEGHQKADRARQQAWREARRAATGQRATLSPRATATSSPATSSPSETAATSSRRVTSATSSRRVTGVPLGGVSRAGIAPQPRGTKEEILLAWDKASRLSRASLERELTEILGESASILGQVGQDRGPVTRRDEGGT
jgi:hypothetical protein